MKKRKTEITVETERLLLIRRRRPWVRAWCDGCAKHANMITAAEAAAAARVSSRTVYRWVEAEKVHFTETLEGLLLICFNSLTKWR